MFIFMHNHACPGHHLIDQLSILASKFHVQFLPDCSRRSICRFLHSDPYINFELHDHLRKARITSQIFKNLVQPFLPIFDTILIFFSRFCRICAQKMAKFEKNIFFEILGAKISKKEEKNQNSGFKFFVSLKSVSKQKIMSIEQFLQELLNFRG